MHIPCHHAFRKIPSVGPILLGSLFFVMIAGMSLAESKPEIMVSFPGDSVCVPCDSLDNCEVCTSYASRQHAPRNILRGNTFRTEYRESPGHGFARGNIADKYDDTHPQTDYHLPKNNVPRADKVIPSKVVSDNTSNIVKSTIRDVAESYPPSIAQHARSNLACFPPAGEICLAENSVDGANVWTRTPRDQGVIHISSPSGKPNHQPWAADKTEPVNPATGEFYLQKVDLQFPGFGVPFSHRRIYRSRLSYDGPMGQGWDFSYNQRLFVHPSNSEGTQPIWYMTGHGTIVLFDETMRTDTFVDYTGRGTDLTLRHHIGDNERPWTLSRPDGLLSFFNASGWLLQIENANGVGLTFNWEPTQLPDDVALTSRPTHPGWRLHSVIDAAGRKILYTYDNANRLVRVSEDTSGLEARYTYDDNGALLEAVNMQGQKETYSYDFIERRSRRGYLPIDIAQRACALTCAPSDTNVEGGDACNKAAALSKETCQRACRNCDNMCDQQCALNCNDSCMDGCLGPCTRNCRQTDFEKECKALWKAKGKKICKSCRKLCERTFNEKCAFMEGCIMLGGISGDFSFQCNGSGQDLKDLVEDTFAAIGFIVIGITDGAKCAFKGFGLWGNCNFTASRDKLDRTCRRYQTLCCKRGEYCHKKSCNIGHDCYRDCKAAFFGKKTRSACLNSGCYSNPPRLGTSEYKTVKEHCGTVDDVAKDNSCRQRAARTCIPSCQRSCTNDCQRNCTKDCKRPCHQACQSCSDQCDQLDSETLTAQCQETCVPQCISLLGDNQASYGKPFDLNYNLLTIHDGNGALYLENTYGTDYRAPTFDRVVSQTYGPHHIELAYRNRLAEETKRTPLPQSGMALEHISWNTQERSSPICPSLPNNADYIQRHHATHATVLKDLHGIVWTSYYNRDNRLLRLENRSNNTLIDYEYGAKGRRTGIRYPLGDRWCGRYDDNGNLVETVHYPTADTTGDAGATTPVRQTFTYTDFPYRLQQVSNPNAKGPDSWLRKWEWDDKGNLLAIHEATGESTFFDLVPEGPARGQPHRIILPNKSETTIEYAIHAGAPQEIIRDAEGPAPQHHRFEYNPGGRTTEAHSPGGETLYWTWNNGRVTGVTRQAEHREEFHFEYDDDGQQISVQRGDLLEQTTYDTIGNVVSITRSSIQGTTEPATTCYRRGAYGRLLEVVSPEGRRTRLRYNARGQVIRITAGSWNASPESWDDACVERESAPIKHTILHRQYDINGRVTHTTDETGIQRILEYDGFGRPIVLRSPQQITRMGYDLLGFPSWRATYNLSATDLPYEPPAWNHPGLLAAEQTTFDEAGRLTFHRRWHFLQNPDDPETVRKHLGTGYSDHTLTYATAARTLSLQDPAGNTTVLRTDGFDRPLEYLFPTGDQIVFEYADDGRSFQRKASANTDSGWITTTHSFTAWGGLHKIEIPADNGSIHPLQTIEYNHHRLPIALHHYGNLSATIEYDAFDRPINHTRIHGNDASLRSQSIWDREGNLVALHSHQNDTTDITQYLYDVLGRTTHILRPDGSETQTSYWNATSLPATIVHPDRSHHEYTYNESGLLQELLAFASPKHKSPDTTRTFNYDALGRMVYATHSDTAGEVSTIRRYDSLGNTMADWTEMAGKRHGTYHLYDARGLPTKDVYSTGLTHTRTYDALGRLRTVQADDSPLATFTYRRLGGPVTRSYASGSQTHFHYDTQGRLDGLRETDVAGDPIATWSWQLSPNGAPTQANFTRPGHPDLSASYQTDHSGRLLSETYQAPDNLPFPFDATYLLDPRDNWLAVETPDLSLDTSPNSIDAYETFGPQTLEYDPRGNLLTDGNTHYEYNPFGALSRVHSPDFDKHYQYDALGRLIGEHDETQNTTTRYAYDSLHRALVIQDSGNIQVTIPGQALDQPLAQTDTNGNTHYLHQDRLGSVYLLTNPDGTPIQWTHYTAYGQAVPTDANGNILPANNTRTNLGFQGHPQDLQTGLVHMRARHYRPDWGRFLTQDPIGLFAGPNLYAFVGSAPLLWRDPLGLEKASPNQFFLGGDPTIAGATVQHAGQGFSPSEATKVRLLAMMGLTASVAQGVLGLTLAGFGGAGAYTQAIDSGGARLMEMLTGTPHRATGVELLTKTGLSPEWARTAYESAGALAPTLGPLSRMVRNQLTSRASLPGMANIRSDLGIVTGSFNAVQPGPLPDKLSATFTGGRYREVVLETNTILYRAGTEGQPLGQFFSRSSPTGIIQSRIDQAVLPRWPGGATSPIDTAFQISIPKGAKVYVGEIGSQGGYYVGGTEQIVIQKPWLLNGVRILRSTPLK